MSDRDFFSEMQSTSFEAPISIKQLIGRTIPLMKRAEFPTERGYRTDFFNSGEKDRKREYISGAVTKDTKMREVTAVESFQLFVMDLPMATEMRANDSSVRKRKAIKLA